MVYLQFPSNLTSEELMLQDKYMKLKRKKKALQDLKTPKPEPERVPLAPKKTTEARDAREVAKKLIKSGVITAPKTPKRSEQSFKRPRGLERKLVSTEKTVSSYQPFAATQPDEQLEIRETKKAKMKGLYECFVSASDSENKRPPVEKVTHAAAAAATAAAAKVVVKTEAKANEGFVLCVTGYMISEDFIMKNFAKFGNILNVKMESDKKGSTLALKGFVTFEKEESAENAIKELDGYKGSQMQLNVAFAKKRPPAEPTDDASSSFMWTSVAANYNHKGLHKDKRDLTIYDDDLFH